MEHKLKRALNATRKVFGASPTIVTTSETMGTKTTHSPLFYAWSKGKIGGDVESPAKIYFVAESQSATNTKDSLWNIKVIVDDGAYVRPVQLGVTFNTMAEFMKRAELNIAREAGFSGPDEAIIAQRKKAVRKSNILRL